MCEPSRWLEDLQATLKKAEEAKKGSKKHAETTTAWRKLSSERVRAVERQMRDYEADSADEEPVHKAETDHSDSEESECEHLPVHEQVLYPTEAVIPSTLPAEDKLLQACETAHRGLSSSDAIEGPAITRELILSGLLQQQYQRTPDCPEATARMLFELAASSRDERLALSSCTALLALLGDASSCTSIIYRPCQTYYVSSLYGATPCMRVCQWAPAANDILDALATLGYKPLKPPASGRAAKDSAAGAEADVTAGQSSAQLQLLNIALLLQLLRSICRAKQAVGGAQGAAWSGHADLVVTLLRLRLDPAACLLAHDLESGVEALLKAMSDSTWERKVGTMAEQASQIGASHRGNLEAVKCIPTGTQRGRLLHEHALVALLKRVLPVKGGAKSAASRRGAVGDVNVPEMLRGMPWFASTKGTRSLAAAAMKDGSDFGTAEVITALQAAHMLVWMHEITQGRDVFIEEEWLGFLKSLEAQFLTASRLDKMSDLKLLFTSLLNFPQAKQR